MAHDHESLEQLESEVKRNTRITTVLLAVFIFQAVLFMFIAYQRVQAMTDPARLADMGEEYLEENYQELGKMMKEQIKKAAPVLAKKISTEATQSLPDARLRLERLLGREFEHGLEAGTDFSADTFRALLKDNRQTIVPVLQEVKELPKETEQAVINLEKAIEKQLEIDIQKQADNVLAFHKTINNKLELLTSDRSLEPRELLEKRILRIARTIQLREMKDAGSETTSRHGSISQSLRSQNWKLP